jgi:hypothetical protein
VQTALCRFGHLATTAELRAAGLSRTELARLRADPAVWTIRRGLHICRHLDADERTAAQCGGRLDCVTVLRAHGIWTGSTRGLHLRLRPGTSRAPARARCAVIHWSQTNAPDKLWMPVPDALKQAMRCLPPDDLVAAIESAVHLKRLTVQQARELVASAPRRLARVLDEVDPHFRAQSGYETKVRLHFTRLGYHVEPQAWVPGVGHLDDLIEGVVAVEIDGRQHDLTVAEDHARDLGTALWGIRVVRVSPRMVDTDLPAVERLVVQLIEEQLFLRHRFGRNADYPKRTRRR